MTGRVRRILRWVQYRRRWRSGMVSAGLAIEHEHGPPEVPRIRAIVLRTPREFVRVRLLAGMTVYDVELMAPTLAHHFGARDCSVQEDRAGYVWLEFTVDS